MPRPGSQPSRAVPKLVYSELSPPGWMPGFFSVYTFRGTGLTLATFTYSNSNWEVRVIRWKAFPLPDLTRSVVGSREIF